MEVWGAWALTYKEQHGQQLISVFDQINYTSDSLAWPRCTNLSSTGFLLDGVLGLVSPRRLGRKAVGQELRDVDSSEVRQRKRQIQVRNLHGKLLRHEPANRGEARLLSALLLAQSRVTFPPRLQGQVITDRTGVDTALQNSR